MFSFHSSALVIPSPKSIDVDTTVAFTLDCDVSAQQTDRPQCDIGLGWRKLSWSTKERVGGNEGHLEAACEA